MRGEMELIYFWGWEKVVNKKYYNLFFKRGESDAFNSFFHHFSPTDE